MSVFSRLSVVSRRKKLELFDQTMKPVEQMRVLDVGSQAGSDGGDGLQLLDVYSWPKNVSALNLLPEHVERIKGRHPDVDARVGDARAMPWPDKHFDIVYSNAVIEHVGGPEDQRRMASEIMRVGKRWFVTTPNRWYPFEFHLRLPFVTWLPWHGYLLAGRLVRYNHIDRRYMLGVPVSGIRLLSASDLARCFPGSRIVKQRVTFMAETLIAVGGEA
ncbi:MAG TPA: class I SAM-dependent methyltransferase [Sedimentisphaerales bacterium]|nr:class I SAM-dependent methyltransferase [Sedimentisphaerales bacterium]